MVRSGIAIVFAVGLLSAGACKKTHHNNTDAGVIFDGGLGPFGTGGSHPGTGGRSGTGGAVVVGSGGATGSGGNHGTGGAATGTGGNHGTGGTSSAMLSDGDIGDIILTLNMGEVQEGNIAVTSALHREVRSFAQTMVTDHTTAEDRENALLMGLNITPRANSSSMMLKSASDALVQKLDATTPAQFDLVYIDAQVDGHQSALDLVNNTLLKSVSDATLKSELQTLAETINAHLTLAKQVRTQLLGELDAGIEDAGR